MPAGPGDTLRELVTLMPSPNVANRWRTYIERHLKSFAQAIRGLPIAPGPGSMSTAEAFWLYRLVTELQPPVIVDSGSATGWSAFIMAAAALDARSTAATPTGSQNSAATQARVLRPRLDEGADRHPGRNIRPV